MDPLERELLLRELDKYGYSLVRTQQADVETVLLRMLESNEVRLLEGFPIVLTSALMRHESVDLSELEKRLPTALQRRFRTLVAASHFLLFWVPDSDSARKQLSDYLEKREPALSQRIMNQFKSNEFLNLGRGAEVSPRRLENAFRSYLLNQLHEQEKSSLQKVQAQKNAAFMDALAELFTERQRELLFKMLNKEPMTKTDREYYSRVVKRRLKALVNEDVRNLASTLLKI